jgi:hypothetical protein
MDAMAPPSPLQTRWRGGHLQLSRPLSARLKFLREQAARRLQEEAAAAAASTDDDGSRGNSSGSGRVHASRQDTIERLRRDIKGSRDDLARSVASAAAVNRRGSGVGSLVASCWRWLLRTGRVRRFCARAARPLSCLHGGLGLTCVSGR